MRQATRTGALLTANVVGELMAACGSGTPSAVEHGRTALPPPRAHTAPSSLCRTYFGSPASIAKEFGAASLKPTSSGPEPQHAYSIFQCSYLGPGPTRDRSDSALTMTTRDFSTDNNFEQTYVGKAGDMYAYAAPDQFTNFHVSRHIQVWLERAAGAKSTK